jgi:hypothetical protein
MTIESTTTIESFGSNNYHRVYIRDKVRNDSQYPFQYGQEVLLRLFNETGLVVVPAHRTRLARTITETIDREVL